MEEDRDLIFNQFANFLFFLIKCPIELSYVNQLGRNKDLQDAIKIADKGDFYDDVRKSLGNIKASTCKGIMDLKMKYITFTTEADNLNLTRAKLNRLEVDILSNCNLWGKSESLDGEEKIKTFILVNPDKNFDFSYKDLKKKESTKSHITPNIFNFAPANNFKMRKFIGAVSHFQILASELSDRMLSEFLDVMTIFM